MIGVQVLSFRNSLGLLDSLMGLASLTRLKIVVYLSGWTLIGENTLGEDVNVLVERSVSSAVLHCLVLVHRSTILLVNAS